MTDWMKSLIASVFLLATCAVRPAMAAEPPADLCSLLPAAEVSKTLGHSYNAPDKSEAPRPFANTATGTDCNYHAGNGPKLWFRAYVDPSPAAATELFAKLGKFYAPPTPVSGLADEAYFDKDHGLHVRKGKVRYFLKLDVSSFTPTMEKQVKDLAGRVAGQL
ncbi:MAG TPA: hypothetical protein VE377_07315 [Candidatus Dormibacteraeota bacterium]|nr:hypothetical protein [Candidatus Dormibacteraeota bacterium]